jgi:hypothetical protein
MKNTTIAKFNEYKKQIDAEKGSDVDYAHDFEKVENILKQGIEKMRFYALSPLNLLMIYTIRLMNYPCLW